VPTVNSQFLLLDLFVTFLLSRCRAPSGQLDGEDVYERRSRDHTDFLATMCEMGALYDNYGIIGDVIVRLQVMLTL
jgi:hypothetical protein